MQGKVMHWLFSEFWRMNVVEPVQEKKIEVSGTLSTFTIVIDMLTA